eukprot:CAMPEP_0115008308 /NCGR_PEP_ID=MMETSP0216-20121206/21827_1 /TAXON_ID=223996 /ORGANISM="Protocruzia adherens, Strain Boccale" /LENGTH=931 /DNA_ID=CAMNT_0002375675 /DNA_START=42 /DNA_END=2837 /DNA_ORIENTATION=-
MGGCIGKNTNRHQNQAVTTTKRTPSTHSSAATDTAPAKTTAPKLKLTEPVNEEHKLTNSQNGVLDTSQNGESSSPLNGSRIEVRRGPRVRNEIKGEKKDEQEMKNAVTEERSKTRKDEELIRKSLSNHFIFANMSDEDRDQVIKAMRYFTLRANEVVFEQGQSGKSYYILDKGSCSVIINGQVKNKIRAGEGFGELALLHESSRTATIKTITDSTFWVVDRTTFRRIIEDMSKSNYDENRLFIDSVPLLASLDKPQKDSLAQGLIIQKYAKDQKIVKEGDPGSIFFILKEGVVSCQKGTKEIRKMYKGEYFGEQALLYNTTRTLTVVACDGPAKCVALGKENLEKILGNKLQDALYHNIQKIAFEKSKVLHHLLPEQIDKVISRSTQTVYKQGEIIFSKGETLGEKFVVLLLGKLSTVQEKVLADKGHCFGEEFFLQDIDERKTWTTSIIAYTDVRVSIITRMEFEECLGGRLISILKRNEALNILKNVYILSHLSKEKMVQLVNVLEIRKYKDGEEIITQNTHGNSFYIIEKGKVDVYKDGKKVRTIVKYDYFGERSLIFEEKRTATIVAQGNVTCWSLSKESFFSIMEEAMRKYLIKRIQLQDSQVALKDLQLCHPVGRGMFGNVYQVKSKNNQVYALKCVSRKKIALFQLEENLRLERNILLQIDHPFIMKLVRSYKDDRRIYFLTEFVCGMELFDVIRAIGLLNIFQSQFYAASIILALQYLHQRNIVYRDVKPENIMVDEEGFCKMIDFGTAKVLKDGRTFTVVGTPHYMAPEVILGKGYGVAVDYWAIGICLYEFLYGRVPFGEEQEDPQAIYEDVLKGPLVFNNFCEDHNAKSVIKALLVRQPELRISGDALRHHKFFRHFNWDSLINRAVKPPHVPGDEEDKKVKEGGNLMSVLLVDSEEDAQDQGITSNGVSTAGAGWDKDF